MRFRFSTSLLAFIERRQTLTLKKDFQRVFRSLQLAQAEISSLICQMNPANSSLELPERISPQSRSPHHNLSRTQNYNNKKASVQVFKRPYGSPMKVVMTQRMSMSMRISIWLPTGAVTITRTKHSFRTSEKTNWTLLPDF
jgi:hypothetical protein